MKCGIALVALAGTFLLCAGCFNSYGGRLPIKGKVTLKGTPLDNGTIEFLPATPEISTKEGAVIVNGTYAIDRQHGLVPGKYRVSITSGDGRTPAAGDQPPGPTGANIVSKDRIPPEYNSKSTQEVEVTAKGPNVFDFPIP
jgi:hypothetical protein